MKFTWRALIGAFTLALMAAFTPTATWAESGPNYTVEQWDENLYCGIGAETTMARPGDEVRVWWKTLDETITGYRIHPVPHNDGFTPNTEGAGYITAGNDTTLFELFVRSSDNSVTCKLPIGILPDGSGTLSGSSNGGPPPPEVCPEGYTGTPPNCVPIVYECPEGYVGTWPNCVPEVQECPEGTTGTYPNCEEDPQECGPNETGTYPDCEPKEHCDNGVGNGEDCSPPGDPPNNDDCSTAEPGSPGCEEDEEDPPGPPTDTGNDGCNNGVGNGEDCQPPGDPPPNDEEGTPGDPDNQGGPPEDTGPPEDPGPPEDKGKP